MKTYNSIFSSSYGETFLRQLQRQLNSYKKAVEYSFATAYFDFRILSEYFISLETAIKNGMAVNFLISNHISSEEFKIIKRAKDYKVNEFITLYPNDYLNLEQKKKLFYWIKYEKIKFRVVFKNKGIFHYKMGYIKYQDNSIFSWSGSANHTFNGLSGTNEEHVLFNHCDCFINSSEYKIFWEAWNGKIKETYVLDIDKVLTSEISTSINFSEEKQINWFKEKWKKALILLKDKVYFINNNGLIIYFAPELNWIHFSKNIVVSKDLNFNKIKLLKWIKDNQDCYISSNLTSFLKDNVSKMEGEVKAGLKIKNHWNDVKKSDEFKEFLSITNNLKRKPFDLQYKQAFFASRLKKTLNFSVPGTGKTMVSLVTFNFLKYKKNVKNIFVIGPTSSHASWVDEFKETFGKNPKVMNLSKIKGDSDKKHKFIKSIKPDDFDMIIAHFSSASKYLYTLMEKVTNETFFVIDEAHYIKNYNGEWGKNISLLGSKSKYSILLTGTPAPNGIEDIYNIISITYGKDFMYHFINSDNKAELISALNMKISYKELKMDFKQINHFHNYNLNLEQKKYLEKINKEIKSSYKINMLELLIKRQQILSSTKLLFKKMYSIDESNKLKTLKKIIHPEKNIVIWANYIKSIDSIFKMIAKYYPKVNVYKYYGKKDIYEREAILENYKKHGGILIANPQTMAESVSIHKKTDFTIYYEYNYNLIHWQQSRNRTYRYGMKNDMHYHILTCSDDFLDKKILESLIKKEFFQYKLINKNNYKDIVMEEIKLLIERMS